MTLEELLEKLKELKYNSTILGKKECFDVITRSEFYQVENLIRQYALDNHDGTLGVLEAKVKTYEAIIANSNFAPLIVKKAEIVISQLREDRDRLQNIIEQIRAEIAEFEEEVFHGTTTYSDYAAVRHCLEIIDKYRQKMR